MDELDLYHDLDEFQEQEEKKSKELEALEDKYQETLKTLKQLEDENKSLKKKMQKIEVNFQNLLDTARSEIQRKNREIDRLRTEKDDLCFRRTFPGHKQQSDSGGNDTKVKSDAQIVAKETEIPSNHNTDSVDTGKESQEKRREQYKVSKRIRSRSRSCSRERKRNSYKRHRSRSRSIERYNRMDRRSISSDSKKHRTDKSLDRCTYNNKDLNHMKFNKTEHSKDRRNKETSCSLKNHKPKDYKDKYGKSKADDNKNNNFRYEVRTSPIKQSGHISKKHDETLSKNFTESSIEQFSKQNVKTRKVQTGSKPNKFQNPVFEKKSDHLLETMVSSISSEDINGEMVCKTNSDHQARKTLSTSSNISSSDCIVVNSKYNADGFEKSFLQMFGANMSSIELSCVTNFNTTEHKTSSISNGNVAEIIEIPGLDLISSNTCITKQTGSEKNLARILDPIKYANEPQISIGKEMTDLREKSESVNEVSATFAREVRLEKELPDAPSENAVNESIIHTHSIQTNEETIDKKIELKYSSLTTSAKPKAYKEKLENETSQILESGQHKAEKALVDHKSCGEATHLRSLVTGDENINSTSSNSLEKVNTTFDESEGDSNDHETLIRIPKEYSQVTIANEKMSKQEVEQSNNLNPAKMADIGLTSDNMCNNENCQTMKSLQHEKEEVLADQKTSSDVTHFQRTTQNTEISGANCIEAGKESSEITSQIINEAEETVCGEKKERSASETLDNFKTNEIGEDALEKANSPSDKSSNAEKRLPLKNENESEEDAIDRNNSSKSIFLSVPTESFGNLEANASEKFTEIMNEIKNQIEEKISHQQSTDVQVSAKKSGSPGATMQSKYLCSVEVNDDTSLCKGNNGAEICTISRSQQKPQSTSTPNSEEGKIMLCASKEKCENVIRETANTSSDKPTDEQIKNSFKLMEQKTEEEEVMLHSLGEKAKLSSVEKNNMQDIGSPSEEHKQNVNSVRVDKKEQNRKHELKITEPNNLSYRLDDTDKDVNEKESLSFVEKGLNTFSPKLSYPTDSQQSTDGLMLHTMPEDNELCREKEKTILRTETEKKSEIPVKQINYKKAEESEKVLPANDLNTESEKINKMQMPLKAMQTQKETDFLINSVDDGKGKIRLIANEIDEENANKVAQVIKLLPELNVVPNSLNIANNEEILPKSLHICNSNATITSKSTQLNIVVASLLKSPYCTISNDLGASAATSPTKRESETSNKLLSSPIELVPQNSTSTMTEPDSINVSYKLNKFITDNAQETSIPNAFKNQCVAKQLPCIISLKEKCGDQEKPTSSTLISNDKMSLDLVRVLNHKSPIKRKDYILPAASVLCNVHNLENATKSVEVTKKSTFTPLAENKEELVEIVDDADYVKTDTELSEKKEMHACFDNTGNSSLQDSLTCLENLSNSDVSNEDNDDNFQINELKNKKKFVLKKLPIVGVASTTKAVSYFKQVGRKRNVKKFASTKSKSKPREGRIVKRRKQKSMALRAKSLIYPLKQEFKRLGNYRKNNITFRLTHAQNSLKPKKKEQKLVDIEQTEIFREEKEMEEKEDDKGKKHTAKRKSCESKRDCVVTNVTDNAQECLENSSDSSAMIESIESPTISSCQIKNIFPENKEEAGKSSTINKLEEVSADGKEKNKNSTDEVTEKKCPVAYSATEDNVKYSDLQCLEQILTANCLKNKSYKIPKLKKSCENRKPLKLNKRKLFNLQDVGIYVGPIKGHLSTFSTSKLKSSESSENCKNNETIDHEIKRNYINNTQEYKVSDTKEVVFENEDMSIFNSDVIPINSEVVPQNNRNQAIDLKNKEKRKINAIKVIKTSQKDEEKYLQLKDQTRCSNQNETCGKINFIKSFDRDSKQSQIKSKEIPSPLLSAKSPEFSAEKPSRSFKPKSQEISKESMVKSDDLVRESVKCNTTLKEKPKGRQNSSKRERTCDTEAMQTQENFLIPSTKPKERIAQESHQNHSKFSRNIGKVDAKVELRKEKVSNSTSTSSDHISKQEENKIRNRIDDVPFNYSQASLNVSRNKRHKNISSRRRILNSSSGEDEEDHRSKHEVKSTLENCDSNNISKRRRTVKVLQVNNSEATPERESKKIFNESPKSPQFNHSIFTEDVANLNSTLTELLPPINSSNTSQDEKFKEIDTQLSAIFQSPQHGNDANVIKINNKMEVNEKTNEITGEESEIKNQENDHSSLNVSTVDTTLSSLNSTANNSTDVKLLSLGSTQYRFEKVSNNVVNLFISRKRKRKKPTVVNNI
uniref:Uncharacterized protein n=1 Tax=Glossina brevipalpis TaxID=37001 RepID=A0A1A9X3C1_9MUSC